MSKIMYEEPEMEVFRYGVEDAITTSNDIIDSWGENETPGIRPQN